MKDGKFETRAEIWRHLLNGGKITIGNHKAYLFLKDDELYSSDGYKDVSVFDWPEKWSIYEEPKPKKKVTLYNYTYESKDKIYETGFSSLDFNMFPLIRGKLLKTESKEIEVDDV